MGLFSQTSSASNDNRQGAGDNSVLIRGGGTVTSGVGNTTVGQNARVSMNSGIQVSGVHGNVTLGDGGAAAKEVGAMFNQTLNQISGQQADAAREQSAGLAGLGDSIRAGLSGLNGAGQSVSGVVAGVVTWVKRNAVWIVAVGVLGVAAVGYLIFRRK